MLARRRAMITLALAFGILIGGVGAVFECRSHETAAFVRISRARLDGTPVVVSTAGHDLTCAQYCRNNIEPTTGAQRVCASFNFDGRETCYFFDDAATPAGTADLNPNPSANNFYYEKTCLPGVTSRQACTFRSFSFERMRKTSLEGFVKKSIQVPGRKECLSACLKETEFVCRSVNYNYDSYMCELSTEDRRSKPTNMRMSDQSVDYYDNNCLTRQNRCGELGGNLIFVKTTKFEIKYYDHTQSVEPQESSCLQKCLESVNTFCRSVEFSPQEKNCIVSDEDTYSRSDQQGAVQSKDYYEPVCVSADLSSSSCRQQAAFDHYIGSAIDGQPVVTAQGLTVPDCISLCFQNLNCKSINYDRTKSICYIYAISKEEAQVKANPSFDYYDFHCESQFGGMALCSNEGIRFIVNTKEPYTGAIYAAEKFSTCSKVVENMKQISITFPPPTVSPNCGTTIKDGRMEALVVVSLDGVLPHQVTTEWDRFYRVSCEVSMDSVVREGSVTVTTLFETAEEAKRIVAMDMGTPPPITATIGFLDALNNTLTTASIGDPIKLVISSEQSGPHNMMVTECTATRVGGDGDALPFVIIDNGCPRYPALVGEIRQDFDHNRLYSEMKAFRLDGSYEIQIECTVMFCAGPNGCPTSNCLNSANNELFVSHGKRKRRSIDTTAADATDGGAAAAETLSAIIRVLAEGEAEEEADIFNRNGSAGLYEYAKSRGAHSPAAHAQSIDADSLVCMAEAWFVSMIVSMSVVCLLLTAFIVTNYMRVDAALVAAATGRRRASKLPM